MMRAGLIVAVALTMTTPATAQGSWIDRLMGTPDFPGIPEDALDPDTPLSAPATGPMPDLAGDWEIQTDRSWGCTLNGSAILTRDETAASGYACEITMRDYCPDSHDGVMRQTCILSIDGSEISIDSTVVESMNGATMSGYSPDNFYLTPAEDGSLVGMLDSAGDYRALWTRAIGAVS